MRPLCPPSSEWSWASQTRAEEADARTADQQRLWGHPGEGGHLAGPATPSLQSPEPDRNHF